MSNLSQTSDFPAIEQLSRALWRSGGGRGAAVLVGAGLSRTALLSGGDVGPPPLWKDLAAAMAERLYPACTDTAPRDPLRLAEEYRVYFGQAALDELVRALVADDPWSPSLTHHALLALPWSDILTTNYDTLLERAARKAERAYEPVTLEVDLAHARAPRIVKLHGSLGASEHFVIAEEDYRTYPERHAAFVNLARQVFVENELVLLGFSGDDPNFAAWTGWVRDHLGTTARRIYLVGALDLGPAKRRLLEARNISPIDLHDLVRHLDGDEQHRAAVDMLLAHLASSKPEQPHRWKPKEALGLEPVLDRDPVREADRLKRIMGVWEGDRHTYPGWVVCPGELRRTLRFSVDSAPFSDNVLATLDANDAARAMVELCWRHRTALWPLHPATARQVEHFAAPDRDDLLPRSDRVLIARVLAWQSRFDEDWARFDRMATLIAALSPSPSDARAEISYLAAARACLEMDFERALELAQEVEGSDPFWKARRAAVLAEAGSQEEAERLVQDAVADLRERERTDRGSIWVGSRLAWSEMMARSFAQSRIEFREWTDRYRASRSDPFEEVSLMRDRILERQRDEPETGLVPAFDPGSYTDRSRTIRFRSWSSIDPFVELDLLLLDGGAPPKLDHLLIFGEERLDALRQIDADTLMWHLHLLRALGGSDKTFAPHFSRLKVARLSSEIVDGMVERSVAAIGFWSRRIDTGQGVDLAEGRLRLAMRTLARLAPRLDPGEAERVYVLALDYAGTFRGPVWAEVVTELLRNAWSAVPPERRPELVPDTLDLPLSSDFLGIEPVRWLYGTSTHRASADPRKARWLDEWTKAARNEGPVRASAIMRLLHLRRDGPLSPLEDAAFVDALWSLSDGGSPAMPASTTVRLSFWADVARPDGLNPTQAVRSRLFQLNGELPDDRLIDVRAAIDSGRVLPNGEQAASCFDRLCAEDPPSVDATSQSAVITAQLSGYDRRYRQRLISFAIAMLAEMLDPQDRTDQRAAAVEDFVQRTRTFAATAALTSFPARQDRLAAAAALVRQGIRSKSSDDVSDAVFVILQWRRRAAADNISAELLGLVEVVVSSIEFRRSNAVWHLLRAANKLVEAGLTASDQNDRLAIALEEMSREWTYADVAEDGEEAGVVSLVRAECVRLADALSTRGTSSAPNTWLALVAADPLPEVRFALSGID